MNVISKFLLLGVLSTAVDYLLYSILILLGVDYVISIFLGCTAGLIVNFYIGRKYIFTAGIKVKSTHHEFISVAIIATIGMLLNMVIVKLLSFSLYNLDPIHSRLIAIVIVFFWNYILRKILVYK
jgi:putative flippase GtrA